MLLLDSTNEIQSLLVELVRILKTPKPWWLIWQPFLGTFLGAALAFTSNYFFLRRKENKELEEKKDQKEYHQVSEINTALCSFAYTKTRLLTFKKDIVLPLRENAKNAEVAKKREESEMMRTLQSLPDFFKFNPKQFFDETNYVEKLAFIAFQHPSILQIFHKIRELLLTINDIIEGSNISIRRYIEQAVFAEGVRRNQTMVTIDMIVSYSEALEKHVNYALAFIQLGEDYLYKYMTWYYPDKNAFKFSIETSLLKYMPPEDYLGEYPKSIEKTIQKDFENIGKK